MLKTGLCSISFRSLSPEEIVEAAANAGLDAIEWGGDAHVPPGRPETARRVGNMTRDAGLAVSSYGSYYYIGCGQEDTASAVLEAACLVGAPAVRLWCGQKPSADVTPQEYAGIVEESLRLAAQAQERGLTLALECHPNTLTDRYLMALRLIQDVNRPNFRMYWQPNQFFDLLYNLQSVAALRPYVQNLHVFHWDENGRHSLDEGLEVWRQYLLPFRESGDQRFLLLEFMPDDSPDSLPREARALRELI